ncbi:MAG: hypothetical protein RLQ25_06665 [Alphaproteobacteria bacterium]
MNTYEMTTYGHRILVLGSPGSGKSTVAGALAGRLGLPCVHLDQHYWRSGWREPAQEMWRRQVAELAAAERWVMDGNYSNTWDLRLPRADLVLYLDMSKWLCRWRVIKRMVLNPGRVRPDMAAGCPERLDFGFLRHVWNVPKKNRPGHLRRLADPAVAPRVRFLRSPRQVQAFLHSVTPKRSGQPPPA